MAQVHSIHNPFSDEEVEMGLMALVAWAGSPTRAARYLKETGKLDVSDSTLRNWKQVHAIRYTELREKYKDQLEEQLTQELRDVAIIATNAARLAVEKATDALESGEERDPARAAANLSKVAATSTDKVLSLTGRPTQITQTRNAEEIIRSLVQLGVIQVPDAPALPEASDAA